MTEKVLTLQWPLIRAVLFGKALVCMARERCSDVLEQISAGTGRSRLAACDCRQKPLVFYPRDAKNEYAACLFDLKIQQRRKAGRGVPLPSRHLWLNHLWVMPKSKQQSRPMWYAACLLSTGYFTYYTIIWLLRRKITNRRFSVLSAIY